MTTWATVTAAQVRNVVARLVAVVRRKPGDPDIIVVFDAGYEPTRLARLPGPVPSPADSIGRPANDARSTSPVLCPNSDVAYRPILHTLDDGLESLFGFPPIGAETGYESGRI
jgi:hypothetical protein